MSTTKTPKADALIEQFGFVAHPAVMAYYAALCETEREAAEMKEEIEVLRCYGNNDCEAMADAELDRRKAARAEKANP